MPVFGPNGGGGGGGSSAFDAIYIDLPLPAGELVDEGGYYTFIPGTTVNLGASFDALEIGEFINGRSTDLPAVTINIPGYGALTPEFGSGAFQIVKETANTLSFVALSSGISASTDVAASRDYYVDSVNGDDTNLGDLPSAAIQTAAGLRALITARNVPPQNIYFAAGSEFRGLEADFTFIHDYPSIELVTSYGNRFGDGLPDFIGHEPIPAAIDTGAFQTFTHTYDISTNQLAQPPHLYENGRKMVFHESRADLIAQGHGYFHNESLPTVTVEFIPQDPAAEIAHSTIDHAIRVNDNVELSYLRGSGQAHDNGIFVSGNSDGTGHNVRFEGLVACHHYHAILAASGVQRRCVGVATGDIPAAALLEFFVPDAAGQIGDWHECLTIGPRGYSSTGYLSHIATGTPYDMTRLTDCVAINTGLNSDDNLQAFSQNMFMTEGRYRLRTHISGNEKAYHGNLTIINTADRDDGNGNLDVNSFIGMNPNLDGGGDILERVHIYNASSGVTIFGDDLEIRDSVLVLAGSGTGVSVVRPNAQSLKISNTFFDNRSATRFIDLGVASPSVQSDNNLFSGSGDFREGGVAIDFAGWTHDENSIENTNGTAIDEIDNTGLFASTNSGWGPNLPLRNGDGAGNWVQDGSGNGAAHRLTLLDAGGRNGLFTFTWTPNVAGGRVAVRTRNVDGSFTTIQAFVDAGTVSFNALWGEVQILPLGAAGTISDVSWFEIGLPNEIYAQDPANGRFAVLSAVSFDLIPPHQNRNFDYSAFDKLPADYDEIDMLDLAEQWVLYEHSWR